MIEMRLTLDYPAPVRSLAREVRRDVIERVTSFTGLEVRHVDIEVARLLRGRAEENVVKPAAAPVRRCCPRVRSRRPRSVPRVVSPGPRRRARRVFRPRRDIRGSVAAVIAAAGIVGAIGRYRPRWSPAVEGSLPRFRRPAARHPLE